MTEDYRIATSYVRVMMQAEEDILRAFEPDLLSDLFSALQNDFIHGELINRIFEAISNNGLVSWVSEYGAQIGVGSHGTLGFAALSAPDLNTALDTLTEHLEIRSTATHARIEQENGVHSYILEDQTGHEIAGRWLIESSFLVVQNLIETIMAHPLGSQAKIYFTYPRQTWHDQVEAVFNARCFYEQADNRLSIPSSWTKVPSPLYDAETYRTNLAKAREIKLHLNADKSNVLNLVTTRLLNHFDRRLSNTAKNTTIPSLEFLANELGMSQRTLIRKLADKKASYKALLDQIRFERAQTLLRETHLTAAEIADKLGYLEAANFGRAFKRWAGISPAAWRRNLIGE